jgi:phage tail-like protein
MANGNGEDALAAYSFQVEIDGVLIAQFKEISGASSEVQVIEHREVKPGGLPFITKLPGVHKWGDITLKKGKTQDMALWNWMKQVQQGDISGARRHGSIVFYDTQHGEVARLNFENGWPSKVSVGTVSADSNDILLEECVITHTGISF